MKIIEILSGIQVPITNEEADVLKKFTDSADILRSELDEREQLLANSLVVKEILRRHQSNGQITYTKKIRD